MSASKPRGSICLITVAGFEDRVDQSLRSLREWYDRQIDYSIIIDFENTILNEPNRSILINDAKRSSIKYSIVNSDIFFKNPPIYIKYDYYTFFFDISGATREQIFKILNILMQDNCDFNIIYTEAEKYYPPENLYNDLIKKRINSIQTLDDKIENKDVIYSKNCTVFSPAGFTGRVEHGRMPLLIGFLTFKRSRLRCILDEIEFPVKIMIVGKPNRDDLQWRKKLLTIINCDNITQATEQIVELDTLCPLETFSKLVQIAFRNDRYFKYNIYLAPLGSKMQTVGSFFFWFYFKSTAIVFSKPQKYFPETFSEGARGTFIIAKSAMINAVETILKQRKEAKQVAFTQ